jgi:hypothetical protein
MAGLVENISQYIKDFLNITGQRIITSVNGAVSMVYAVLVVAAGLSTKVFDVMVKAATVFACGSLFDLLKAYGAIYKDK